MQGLSPKQAKIFQFPKLGYDALICDGSIRSGKTIWMCIAFLDDAMSRFSGRWFGICGKTVDSAVKNVVLPFLTSGVAEAQGWAVRWQNTRHLLTLSKGSRENTFEVFGGKDESSYQLIQGRTLAGVLLDEVVLQPRSFVEQALARCSVQGSKFWFNCNPEGPEHWFKKEWINKAAEKNALHIHFTLEDNPGISPEVRRRYERMYSGVFYDRYIRGLWSAAEGLVYPQFDREKHLSDKLPSGGRAFISIDYGTLNPCAFGLWILDGQDAWMVREYYYNGRETGRQKTDEEYYSDLEKFAQGYPIEAVIIDPSAASFKATIRRRGRFFVRDARNEVLDGIRFTASMLQQGRLHFSTGCEQTVREFGAYIWDPKAKGEDRVLKANDHSMDQMRYFVFTVMRREVRYGI